MKITIKFLGIMGGLYSFISIAVAPYGTPLKVTTAELKNLVVPCNTEPKEVSERKGMNHPLMQKLKEKPKETIPSDFSGGFYPEMPTHLYDSTQSKKGLSQTRASSVAYMPQIGINFTPSSRWDAAVPAPGRKFS